MFGFSSMEKMTPEQAMDIVKQDKTAVLLDVRTPQEYRQGNIPGSINIPLDELSRIKTKVFGKGSPILVYCLSGARARTAYHQLKSMGYENVYYLGGINRWPYPLKKSKSA